LTTCPAQPLVLQLQYDMPDAAIFLAGTDGESELGREVEHLVVIGEHLALHQPQ